MKTTVNEHDFRRAFEDLRPDNFSHEGLGELYNHLIEYEENVGAETELDVIAFCCDYTEYADLAEFQGVHVKEYKSIDEIADDTLVVRVGENGFIVQDF